MIELSVVIPVMNEEDNIPPLLEAVRNALNQYEYEIILVDDGSTDGTKKKILEHADARTILVELRKNYGQSTAMTAGIDHAHGEYIAMLDGDLQKQERRNGATKNSEQNSQCINSPLDGCVHQRLRLHAKSVSP